MQRDAAQRGGVAAAVGPAAIDDDRWQRHGQQGPAGGDRRRRRPGRGAEDNVRTATHIDSQSFHSSKQGTTS